MKQKQSLITPEGGGLCNSSGNGNSGGSVDNSIKFHAIIYFFIQRVYKLDLLGSFKSYLLPFINSFLSLFLTHSLSFTPYHLLPLPHATQLAHQPVRQKNAQLVPRCQQHTKAHHRVLYWTK